MILFARRWTHAPYGDIDAMAHELEISPALCRLLISRGITSIPEARAFLHPDSGQFFDPFLFRDMDLAVSRLEQALDADERICVFGDYDVDGVCATAMLTMYLEYLGCDVFYHIPSRHNEGYGMTPQAIERVHERGAKLIITVDNGIVATGETALAKQLGMDVIITDHHKAGATLPSCTAVLCHSRSDNTYPNTDLCGAGVALKLIEAHGGESAAQEFLPFAAFATVSDVMPLIGENRAIVSLALNQLNSGDWPSGLRALAEVSGITDRPVTARDFAFALGPRLNAAGRLENASLGVELLRSESIDEAMPIAERLNELNNERRNCENDILDAAHIQLDELDMADSRIILLKSTEWNPGVLGIAASRITEEYHRPTILFREEDGVLTGSARSIPGVDIHSLLSQFSDMYTRFGGHAMAAGLTLPSDRFSDLNSKLNAYAANTIPNETFIPECLYDTELDFKDITPSFIDSLNRFEPFGEGNPAPTFVTREAKLYDLRIIGKNANHLNGKAQSSGRVVNLVAFNKAPAFHRLLSADSSDILYSPSLNDWGKAPSVQLRIQEFAPCRFTDPESHIKKHASMFYEAFLSNLIYTDDETPNLYSGAQVTCLDPFECFSQSFAGGMMLCFTMDGAIRAIKHLYETDIKADICFRAPDMPQHAYNTLVIAPHIDKLLKSAKHMKRIVLFDGVYDEAMMKELSRSFNNAEFFVPETAVLSDNIASEFKSAASRENMGQLYREVRLMLSASPLYLDECVELLSLKTNVNPSIACFAVRVFTELGFINQDKNSRLYAVPTPNKRPLTDSPLYSRLENINLCSHDFIRKQALIYHRYL